jgi:hypothetical protein
MAPEWADAPEQVAADLTAETFAAALASADLCRGPPLADVAHEPLVPGKSKE